MYEAIHVHCQDMWQLVVDVQFGKAEQMHGIPGELAAAAFAPLSHAALRLLFDAAAPVASGLVSGAHGFGSLVWQLEPCANKSGVTEGRCWRGRAACENEYH